MGLRAISRRYRDRLDVLSRVDPYTRAKFPKGVSCVKVRGCDESGAPGRLAPGGDAVHALSV